MSFCDTPKPTTPEPSAPNVVTTNTTTTEPLVCPVTGAAIPAPTGQRRRRFVSATMLRHDDDLLLQLMEQHTQYAKGLKEDQFTRSAHNVRNAYHNPRNNARRKLRRAINKITRQPTLFDVWEMVRLSPAERAALDPRPGAADGLR